MKRLVATALVVTIAAGPAVLGAQTPARPTTGNTGLSAATRTQLMASVARGGAFIKSQTKADGTWENHPGVTAMAAAALLRQPGATRADAQQSTAKAIAYLRSLAKPDGGIYIDTIPHYITAVSIQALVAAGQAQDKPLIEKGRRYLADHLLDESEGVPPSDKFYGGMGYGGTSDGGRADIISLEYGLRAMKEAGLAANDPAWDKAIKFLQRTQNRSETNDQPWATNDGGLIYYPGYSQVADTTRSYGSASYAGIMSYSWANVKKTDDRVQSVLTWVRNNYTVEENPGIGTKALYYYYMVLAKALQAVDENVIVDARGQRHNWREDLAKKLIALQNADGSWVNSNPAEMQGNKVLVTAFTLMAAEAILK
jgi:squalene-hopene/tetraprenyl-beta-curcumene cyclase